MLNKDSYKHIYIPLNGGNINCHDQYVQVGKEIMYKSYLYIYIYGIILLAPTIVNVCLTQFWSINNVYCFTWTVHVFVCQGLLYLLHVA